YGMAVEFDAALRHLNVDDAAVGCTMASSANRLIALFAQQDRVEAHAAKLLTGMSVQRLRGSVCLQNCCAGGVQQPHRLWVFLEQELKFTIFVLEQLFRRQYPRSLKRPWLSLPTDKNTCTHFITQWR